MRGSEKEAAGRHINDAFNRLQGMLGDPTEFELPDWFNKSKPYTFIKRNIYLTKKVKRRLDDDGIFCSCSSSPNSSGVCDRDCHCGMLLSSCSSGCNKNANGQIFSYIASTKEERK